MNLTGLGVHSKGCFFFMRFSFWFEMGVTWFQIPKVPKDIEMSPSYFCPLASPFFLYKWQLVIVLSIPCFLKFIP